MHFSKGGNGGATITDKKSEEIIKFHLIFFADFNASVIKTAMFYFLESQIRKGFGC